MGAGLFNGSSRGVGAVGDLQEVFFENDSAWLLLAELNHRVGNELTAALSALRMAQRDVRADAQPSDFIDQAVIRLENFGQVHHLLDRYRGHGSLRQRLEALCRAIAQSKGAPQGIHIAVSADEVAADDETTWTVCVAASELLTNAFRHAFAHNNRGVVGVDLRAEEEWVILTVADNGMGFAPRDVQPVLSNPGLGWAIVTELAQRLGGAITHRSGPMGTAITLRVPVRRTAQ